MSTQISLKLSDSMLKKAKEYANSYGYDTLQDFIRELIREKLFEGESTSGIYTMLASEESLSTNWLCDEEDKAWEKYQKGK